MPRDIKTEEQERLWFRAKRLAEKQGQGGNWAYVRGIYNQMTKAAKSLEKSFIIPPAARMSRVPGQVPGRFEADPEAIRQAETRAPGMSEARLLAFDEPIHSTAGIVRGLGLQYTDEQNWINDLDELLDRAPNEVVLRRGVLEKCTAAGLEPTARRAVLSRSLTRYRSMNKSVIEVYSVDELLEKAKYTKRWRGKDGRWQYEYDKPKSTGSRKGDPAAGGPAARTIEAVNRLSDAEGKHVEARVGWDHGDMAKIEIHTTHPDLSTPGYTKLGHIVIQDGKAMVPREVKDKHGHGRARLPSHPGYPAPIESQFILFLERAVAAANDPKKDLSTIKPPAPEPTPAAPAEPEGPEQLGLFKAKYKSRKRGKGGKYIYEYDEPKAKRGGSPRGPSDLVNTRRLFEALPGGQPEVAEWPTGTSVTYEGPTNPDRPARLQMRGVTSALESEGYRQIPGSYRDGNRQNTAVDVQTTVEDQSVEYAHPSTGVTVEVRVQRRSSLPLSMVQPGGPRVERDSFAVEFFKPSKGLAKALEKAKYISRKRGPGGNFIYQYEQPKGVPRSKGGQAPAQSLWSKKDGEVELTDQGRMKAARAATGLKASSIAALDAIQAGRGSSAGPGARDLVNRGMAAAVDGGGYRLTEPGRTAVTAIEKERAGLVARVKASLPKGHGGLEKAEARGGSYHRRVPRANGKGYTYYYDEDKYKRSRGAHVAGEEAGTAYITGKILKAVQSAGDGGCEVSQFEALVKKYGAKRVGDLLRGGCGGQVAYKGGKFYYQKPKAELEKSGHVRTADGQVYSLFKAEDKSGSTAIGRKSLSSPMAYLKSKGLIRGRTLDYGSGKGSDAKRIGADAYDPNHAPDNPEGKYDTITSIYVLNVLKPGPAAEVVRKVKALLKPGGKAYFAVRRDLEKEGKTSTGTYQRTVKMSLPKLYEDSGNFAIYVASK